MKKCPLCLREGHTYVDCPSLSMFDDLTVALASVDDGYIDIDRTSSKVTIRALRVNGQWSKQKGDYERLAAIRDKLIERGYPAKLGTPAGNAPGVTIKL